MIPASAKVLVEGEGVGAFVRWHMPLSFWGGFDTATGRVIDRSHPAFGQVVAGCVLAMPSGRGSSSASSVLAEAIRCGTAPAALILETPDPILVVGAIVAQCLYGARCPIVICDPDALAGIEAGATLRVTAGRTGSVSRAGPLSEPARSGPGPG